ncbi:hypothetical protein H6F88_16020 [Oculatella sp. FACHB-28]|nr:MULTISPECIES: hypothetical protein [Cyanophyceae]MBD1867099.1 hypothetical protein [Cyanobacteria bacterium FACHB-471]MBD2057510.1 hypothetical protein [Oculatella sp. FACHB-28]MBD2070066.1 hypothetical protein [Leptolyngbya sp. FACHB-671]
MVVLADEQAITRHHWLTSILLNRTYSLAGVEAVLGNGCGVNVTVEK